MSADFWAGYISGAVGILIGNPLDLLKVRLQARDDGIAASRSTASFARRQFGGGGSSPVAGAAAPVLGYGALNALLFVSYNRCSAAVGGALALPPDSLWTAWLAGAAGGLATWIVSAPTELVKCRAQLAASSSSPASSWAIARDVFGREGVRGFYFGGAVTALRDSVGYGFYFWSYELGSRWAESPGTRDSAFAQDAAKVLLCGGLAGIVSWVSVFPLDVIKTRVQTQAFGAAATPLLGPHTAQQKRLGAVEIARNAYREQGLRVFFRGLTICSIRAFFVNAVQWGAYEWIMLELGQGRHKRATDG